MTDAERQQRIDEWKANRNLSTEEVVNRLPADVRPFSFLVGAWVWVEFPQRPDDELLNPLRDLGFKWNRTRHAWQHPCGVFRRRSRGADPRFTYGAVPVQEEAKP